MHSGATVARLHIYYRQDYIQVAIVRYVVNVKIVFCASSWDHCASSPSNINARKNPQQSSLPEWLTVSMFKRQWISQVYERNRVDKPFYVYTYVIECSKIKLRRSCGHRWTLIMHGCSAKISKYVHQKVQSLSWLISISSFISKFLWRRSVHCTYLRSPNYQQIWFWISISSIIAFSRKITSKVCRSCVWPPNRSYREPPSRPHIHLIIADDL